MDFKLIRALNVHHPATGKNSEQTEAERCGEEGLLVGVWIEKEPMGNRFYPTIILQQAGFDLVVNLDRS